MNQPINYEDKKLTIKQWSVQDRPREKYAKNGALALSDAELIAILLRTGNPNDSAVELAKKLLAQSGNSLSRLSGKSLRELHLRDRFQLNIMAIRENGVTSATMDPDQPLTANAELFAVAKRDVLDHILH